MTKPNRPQPGHAPASLIGLVSLAFIVLAGCSLFGGSRQQAGPCADIYNAARCLAMTDFSAVQLGATREDVVSIDVLPEPTVPAQGVRSGGGPIHVRVTLRDGTEHVVSMGCGGIRDQPTCSDRPHLSAVDSIANGYGDVPCAGEPPAGCATAVPTPDPAALADAVALRLPQVDIAIDHVGDYDVRIGEAQLPNGLLTEVAFGFVDDWPSAVTILSGTVQLDVQSLEPDGLPFNNIYEHGWRQGTEHVAAIVRFHVDRFDPGGVLSITNVVVR